MSTKLRANFITLLIGLALAGTAAAAQTQEERSLSELRNTVVNMLQALVERGIITREQAEAMVRNAQAKAATDLAAQEAQQKAQEEADKGAVRVPYVPQIVKDEISKEVVAQLTPSVKQEVEKDINTEGTLRSALPDWVQNMRWTGDVRIRNEGDVFASNNLAGSYLDYNQINSKGGIAQAGSLAALNTTENRDRLRVRVRFGFDVNLGAGWTAGARLATGTGEIFATTNQTLGTYGQKYQIALDQGFVRWQGTAFGGRQLFTTQLGRFANPWLGTDLVWYNDLTFEGLTGAYRLNLSHDNAHRRDVFLTVGAFPLQSYALFDPNPEGRDKWLAAGQLGVDLRTENDSRFTFGAAYYDYLRIVGQRNALDNPGQFNWTLPPLVQKGNTLFDINSAVSSTNNLYGLAADYKLVDLTATAEWRMTPRYALIATADAVRNIGFKWRDVQERTGYYVAPRTHGYRADLGFASNAPGLFGTWKLMAGYRYLQRDAVLDAFNDQDFHLGGTDTRGYTVMFDYSVNPRVFMRVKYLSANEIDGPPLGIDVWQVEVNTQF
jgi:hypothetical protein